jgi:putative ABC transport system permease protein
MLMREWWSRVRALFARDTFDEELRVELDAHLQMEIEANLERGMAPDEARQAAARRFGNRTVIQERAREAWTWRWFDALRQDVRLAGRSLWRNPGFSLVAILILALGIGASTAVFSVVHAVVLKPLAFREPDRIVALRSLWKKTGDHGPVSLPDFNDWRTDSTSFESMAFYSGGESAIAVDSSPQFATVTRVSSDFFRVLGVAPALGRVFQPDEVVPGSGGAAVVSHSFWLSRLNGEIASGTSMQVAGRVVPIVGVMPIGFRFPDPTDVWIPADTVFRVVSPNRGGHNYFAVAKLKAGVSLDNAQAEMTTIGDRLEQQYPGTNGDKNVVVAPQGEEMVRDSTTMLYLLLSAVMLLLLIACGNVANLLLAKAAGRTREMGVRTALGAGRGRLIRQLATESLVLGIVSGFAGLALARLGTVALVALAPADVPRLNETGIDTAVLGFATLLTLLACLVFGLVPALRATRIDVNQALKQAGSGGPQSIGSRLRRTLVVAEIALSAMLLIGAGLLIRSFDQLSRVNLGFQTRQVLVMETANPIAPASGVDAVARVVRMYGALLDQLAEIPGVVAVGAVRIPPGRVASSGGYVVDGAVAAGLSVNSPQAVYSVVSHGAFAVLGIPLRNGRDFSAADVPAARRTAIVNETLAKQAFPGEDPVGHTILAGLDSSDPMTIVGVVADIHQRGPGEPAMAEVYMPYAQHPLASTALRILARTSVPPETVIEPMRERTRRVSGEMPVKFTTLDARLSENVAIPRFRTLLVAIFAAVALALTVTGVYGVVSFLVGQRTREIGLRMALGASGARVLNMVLSQALWMGATGMTLGLAGAAGTTRLFRSMLFEVRPFDLSTYVVVAGVILLVTVGACVLPARRASRIDPMLALRQE